MLSFMKVPPTTYVLQYKHGKIKREGAGLSFILTGTLSPRSSFRSRTWL